MSIINICGAGVRPVIAYSEGPHNEYLVVWIYSYRDPGDDATTLRDIKAQRLRSYGALIGDEITVARETSTRVGLPLPTANVVYNRATDEYLVIWDNQYGDSLMECGIQARRVASDGRLVGNEFYIATHLWDESRSVIAYNSSDNEYVVAWESGRPYRQHNIHARRVASDGRTIGAHIDITLSEKNETRPAIAYNSSDNEYLVVWESWYSETDLDIRARRVASDGRLVGNEFNIAASLKNESRPVIAYNSNANEYLVVWEYWHSETDLDIRARRVASDGRLVGTHFSIATSLENETRPAIAYNSSDSEYLVVWEYQHSETDLDIRARPVGSGGAIGNFFTIAGTFERENSPVIAYNTKANEYLVVWGSWSWPNDKIRGRRLKDGRTPA